MEKMVKDITSIDKDFCKWYTDVVVKAELIDYSNVRGCFILRPYGFSIWENIVSIVNQKFKEIGVENVSMPILIPENLLQKEKNHISGFAPEVAWVTMGGEEKFAERLCIRPTSEVLFCSHFSKIIQSWRDLPKLYNQWCSVVRWEKTSRPFLRSVEIHWQEGHTVHETEQNAKDFTLKMLNIYASFFEKTLCIPVVLGKKTESEKFAGAETTYTVECMMKDGKALQSATSHYFGNKFSKAFGIKFKNKKNVEEFVYQTSWGLSTRVIAGIIMTHGDNDGLVLPPDIAPIQVVIIPIQLKNEDVLKKSYEIFDKINKKLRTKLDISDKSPGWKFANYEMKGVPIRIEIGLRDIKNDECQLVRRDTRKKYAFSFDNIEFSISNMLDDIKKCMYVSALKIRDKKILSINSVDECRNANEGFIKLFFCGTEECEKSIKENFGLSSICIPIDSKLFNKCLICGKYVSFETYFGKSY